MLSGLQYDVRYAARTLSRSRGFAIAAILTVALGIGTNTAVFSVLNGALLRDLPVAGAHQLVSVHRAADGVPLRIWGRVGSVATAEYEAYRDSSRALSGLMGYSTFFEAAISNGSARKARATFVTCGYFDVLQQPPVLGRNLARRDCEAGADPVVVLGHSLWTTAFDADPAVIGRTVDLNRQPVTVIGIAPEGMRGIDLVGVELFVPTPTLPLLRPDIARMNEDATPLNWLTLIGRRARDSSLEQARAELDVIAAQLDRLAPGRSTTLTVRRASVSGNLGAPLVSVGAVAITAFALILLIACANVANLLLSRATARGGEIALRLSLGATRIRVVRQLVTESLLIFLAGGALGSVLAVWSAEGLTTMALSSLATVGVPALFIDTSPDLNVLAFAAALSLGTGLLFGLAPALHASRPDLHSAAKPGASMLGTRGSNGLRGLLVGAQVALCMVLLVGAALLLRGLHAAQTAEPGFEYRDTAVVSVDLRGGGYDDSAAAVFQRQLAERIGALPGVEAVASAALTPMYPGNMGGGFRTRVGEIEPFSFNVVSPEYFSVIGTPIVAGRTFTEAETALGWQQPVSETTAGVAVVTEATARRHWPGQDPIGQVLMMGSSAGSPEYRIIGVVKDAELRNIGEVPTSFLYLAARPGADVQHLVKSETDFASTAASIRAAVAGLDPELLVEITPLENNLVLQQTLSRLVTTLATALGALGLVLASVGIYGVVSYAVVQRFRELGVRIALGAMPRNLLALLLKQTMRPVVLGAGLGFMAALMSSESLSAVLFGVDPADPLALGSAAVFLVGIALTAAIVAGRRAMRADPMTSLRHE